MDFSCLFTIVVLPACFLLGRSASVHRLFLLLSSINRFSSGQVRSSPSTQLFLLFIVTSSASVRQLFMLFYSPVPLQSVNCFCSSCLLKASLLARFALVHRLFLLFQSSVPLQSVDCLCSSHLLIASLHASFALVRRLLLLFSLMDLGGVRRKMTRTNCERINTVKTVNGYGF